MGANPESRNAGNLDVSGFRVRRFAPSRNDRGEFFSSLLANIGVAKRRHRLSAHCPRFEVTQLGHSNV